MTADLFHYPMACSTACRIAAAEADLPLNIFQVDLYNKTLEDGTSFFDINPIGQVATLRTSGGDILTENIAILLWIARHANDDSFAAHPDNENYSELLQWTSYCAMELHKHILWPIFRTDAPKEVKAYARSRAPQALAHLNRHLSDKEYLLGGNFTAADAYLTWFLSMTRFAGIVMEPYKNLEAYFDRVQSRPKVAPILAEDLKSMMIDVQANGKRPYAENPALTLNAIG